MSLSRDERAFLKVFLEETRTKGSSGWLDYQEAEKRSGVNGEGGHLPERLARRDYLKQQRPMEPVFSITSRGERAFFPWWKKPEIVVPVVLAVIGWAIVIVLWIMGGGREEPVSRVPEQPTLEGYGLDEEELEVLFRKATSAEGVLYLAFRDAIAAEGKTAAAFLRKRRKAGETWQERVLAEILIERIEHADELARLVREELDYPYHRRRSEQAEAAGKALAERFRDTPMILAEFLWKRNELERMPKKDTVGPLSEVRSERDAYVVRALDILGERRALWPLMQVLERGEHLNSIYASEGIKNIGSSAVLGDLIRIAETGSNDVARILAREAMAGCVDSTSLPLLEKAADETKDLELRAHYRKLIKDVQARR